MKVISISERSLKRMPMLQLSNKIVSTEGKLYIYDHKDKWNHLKELLKIFYIQTDAYLSDKFYVLSQLIANYELIDIPELVLPSSLVSVNGNISGFSMPFVENNVNLTLFLNNPKVKLEQKIRFLGEIYLILDKIMKIRELEGNFFMGDIHEANFILDIDEQIVKAVDLDSSYINGSKIPVSKFLTSNKCLADNPQKYPVDKSSGMFKPNKNTTILSFIYMLLNVLSGNTDSHKWSFNEFYNYIYFLEQSGCSKELISSLLTIYSKSTTNEFPLELLSSIDVNRDYSLKRARIPKTDDSMYYYR